MVLRQCLERRQLLEDFRAGVYPVLVNCAILTEGRMSRRLTACCWLSHTIP